jgi:hypothetical protein
MLYAFYLLELAGNRMALLTEPWRCNASTITNPSDPHTTASPLRTTQCALAEQRGRPEPYSMASTGPSGDSLGGGPELSSASAKVPSAAAAMSTHVGRRPLLSEEITPISL